MSAPAAGRTAIRGRVVVMDDDDRAFRSTLADEANLPAYLAPGLLTAFAPSSGATRSG